MGMFYDPIKKKPQTWVFVAFVVVPIIIIIVGYIWGTNYAKSKPVSSDEVKESPSDFFSKFHK